MRLNIILPLPAADQSPLPGATDSADEW